MESDTKTSEHEGVANDISQEEWYSKAKKYWSEVPATVDGVLGGFGFISQVDIQGSDKFLRLLFQLENGPKPRYALDCGAGIGRVTKLLLSRVFEKVDLVEQNPAFLKKFKDNLEPEMLPRIGNTFCCGLQNFTPKEGFYDVIWIQWVAGQLTDDHLIKFLKDSIKGLSENGVIVLKENVTSTDEVEVDEEESSVTRPLRLFKDIFVKSGLKCICLNKQEHFPKGLYRVYMFALTQDV